MVAAVLFGRGILGRFARKIAARRIDIGAITAAEEWIEWSAWVDAGDGRTELMRATCFRHLRQGEPFGKALQAADRKGAPPELLEQEVQLGRIQSGRLGDGAERRVAALIEGGVSPHEVAAAFVYGFLAQKKPDKAREILDAWAADFPEDARVAYMRGVYWQWSGNRSRAGREFKNCLARQPRHELARTALAELIEEQDRLDQALEQYVELATLSRGREATRVGLARVLRELGRVDKSRAVLESLASRPRTPPLVAMEMGQIELESGHYAEADTWFRLSDVEGRADYETVCARAVSLALEGDREEAERLFGMLRAAATALALAGESARAERLFTRVDAAHAHLVRINDLRERLAACPGDERTRDALRRASSPSTIASPDVGALAVEQAGDRGRAGSATSASELYALHCSACHGARGGGNGRAARHLFPRPRDLRTGKARLVSTRNGVPTPKDVEAVLRQGMPGTSMPSFEHLAEGQRKQLALEVLRMNREGIREQLISTLKSEGEEVDEDEVREVVQRCTTPEEVVRVPQIGPADSRSIARGRNSYLKLGCNHCHGDDGSGPPDTRLFDDKGRPAPPRDLAYEPFKGGQKPESIFLRLFVGMPGTPHPACWNLPEGEVIDLVHYCRSLSRQPKRTLTNHQRATIATSRDLGRLAAPGASGSAIPKAADWQ